MGDKIVGVSVSEEYARWAYEQTRPDQIYEKPEALKDLLVLDLSYGNFAGLFASSILAEAGANVIRIEPPEGDIARKMTPNGIMIKDTGLAYLAEARNKLHITLDLKMERGREIFEKLARKAHVIIETFKPGRLDSMGIGYLQLREQNPGLIYCAIYSYGHFGEESERHGMQPDYDIIAQARGVIMSVTGEPDLDPQVPKEYKRPLKHGNWMGWYVGGAWAAFGINAALLYKAKTGNGQFLDCSPPEGLMCISNYVMQYYHITGELMPRAGNYDYAVFPYTYERCKDGYVFIGAYSDPSWRALCEIMERPDLAKRFPTPKERLDARNQPVIQHEIEKFTVRFNSEDLLNMVDEYNKRPDRKGVVVMGRLESPKEILEREHWRLRHTFHKDHDPYYGELLVQNSTLKSMSRTPGRIKWICRKIGADNYQVYQEYLGMDKEVVDNLKSEGII